MLPLKPDSDIVLREASTHDASAVCALWLDLMHEHEALDARFVLSEDAPLRWKNDFPLWVEDQTRMLLLAELSGELVGFIQAHRRLDPPIFKEKPEVFIDELYVVPSARKRGVGRLLLDAIRTWAREVGAAQLRLRVLSANSDGLAFWERHGARSMDIALTIELEVQAEKEKEHRSRKLGF